MQSPLKTRIGWRGLAALTSLALVVLLLPAGGSAAPPNIVFIALDDQDYTLTSTFGAIRAKTTPNLDALAREGVRFTDGIVQGTQCAPSRNSTITGRYPHQLGYYHNGDREEVEADVRGFPESLQRAGYHTAWIGKSHLEPAEEGLTGSPGRRRAEGMRRQFGFDEVFQHPGRWISFRHARNLVRKSRDGADWRADNNIYLDALHQADQLGTFVADYPGATTLPADLYMEGYISERVENWIDGYGMDQPFFLYINYSGPHEPYDQPKAFQDLYEPDDLPPLLVDDDRRDIPDVMQKRPDTFSAAKREEHRLGHVSMVTYMDTQLARVLAALEARGMRDNTLIVYFTDHGVMNGNHGLYRKATLYREVLHANLVIDLPEKLYAEQTNTITRPVELLDAVQTALDVAGVPTGERQRYEGESLLPLLVENESGTYAREYAFAEIEGATAVVGVDWKYIDNATKPVLFDRVADPGELANVIDRPANAEVVARMRDALADFYLATGRPRVAGGGIPPARSLTLGKTEFLVPPMQAGHGDGSAGAASGADTFRVQANADELIAETCEAQGGASANAAAAERFADALNAQGGRLALVRLGWPAERDVRFVTGAQDTAWAAVSWQGTAFVHAGEAGGAGYPLCVRK